MVVGFNHNIMYRGEVFHVQTEDNGVNSPTIVTLLYRGGTIISSRKTSYADIVKIDNLEQVVEELMKDQHKEMLRQLKAGAFDDRAFPKAAPPVATVKPQPVAPPVPKPTPVPPVAPQKPEPKPKEQSLDDIIFSFLSSDGDK